MFLALALVLSESSAESKGPDLSLTECEAFFPSSVWSDTPTASTLYIADTQTTFSINIPENSTDIYFYFSSPAYSWVAVGAGSDMAGSLMMIMYSAADNQRELDTKSGLFL